MALRSSTLCDGLKPMARGVRARSISAAKSSQVSYGRPGGRGVLREPSLGVAEQSNSRVVQASHCPSLPRFAAVLMRASCMHTCDDMAEQDNARAPPDRVRFARQRRYECSGGCMTGRGRRTSAFFESRNQAKYRIASVTGRMIDSERSAIASGRECSHTGCAT